MGLTGGNLKWGLSAAGYLDPDIFLFFQENIYLSFFLASGWSVLQGQTNNHFLACFVFDQNLMG